MCERDSSIKAAFTPQRFHASEEHNSCAYTNSISKKKILPITNLEPRSFQSTLANSESHDASSSLCYNADVVSLNGNSSSSSSMTSSASNNSSTSSAPQSLTSIGVNLRVTGQCSQGGRKYMEDYFSVAYQQSENANDLEYAFVGIYDGHGGAEAATFAKEHLMMEIINQKLFWSDSDQDVLRAIREGYIATHYAMWRDQENWPKTATGLLSTAGTTATVAFIRREKLYIGHVGDSGIVLGYQDDNEDFWRAKPLTTDHKPESLEERARITRSGGKVIVKSGVPRVVWNRPRLAGHKGPIRRNTPVDEIPFLAVARSLGDLWSYNSERNEFVVSPDPDVKVIQINPKTFRCLIFGTDGLWNVVSPQEAVDCVHEKETINQRLQAQRGESPAEGSHGQWTNPSKGLVNKALKTWAAKKMRADNTSVVTVILYPPGATIDANPPGCQGLSYGVEYTRLNAEILTHDDATTYAELATKYTPPEEYRNFKYDDDEPLKINLEPLLAPYAAYSHAYDGFQPVIAAAGHDYYDATGTREMNGKKTSAAEEEDDNEIDDEDEVCEEESDDNYDGQEETLTAMNTYASDDLPHCSQVRLACSKDALQSKLMEQESLDYMNSFAESYTDSLLGGHSEETIANARRSADKSDGDCSDSTSSSSGSSSASGFHSAVYQHNQELQHELLMEHELYQAQCMSQEEGYSLTKLETRGEQQMRYETSVSAGGSNSRGLASKEVQTFQIFQQQNEPLSHTYSESSISIRSSPSYNISSDASSRENLWEPRYQPLCRFINPYETPKLELNSLLQQEIEEEQQVAMERLEMQRRRVEQSVQQNTVKDPEGCISAEYLEEELVAESADVDASIQINEISSSMESPMESEEMEIDALVEEDEMEDYAHQLPQQQPHSTKKNIVLIEKIEILQHKPELVIECAPSKSITSTSLHQSSSHTKLLRSKPSYVSASGSKTPSKALINPSPSKRPHFPNVPNENQRFSLRHCNSSAYATLQHQRTDNRQLRSMAPSNVVDYSKRTLRSRNSLSKDMKAKTTLNLRRSTSMSNQYLRTTAASLLGASATQQQQQMSTQRRQRENARPQASVSHLTVALRNTKSAAATSAASNATLYGINLRSRQIVAPVAATQRTNNTSSMHHLHLQQSCEKRNLRSLSAKEAMATTATGRRSCKESNISGNFSKATRLQSTAANLAGPPPSPKLICVAKRARSLLPPKMVPDDFSKRSTLRSAAELTAATAAVRSALQTRSRVQKHMTR